VLRGKNLTEAIEIGKIGFDGVIRKDSLLISLGSSCQEHRQTKVPVDPYSIESIEAGSGILMENWNKLVIKPDAFVLLSAKETVRLNEDYYGLLTTLSHTARLGLMVHPSSFFIDPCFSGHLTLEVKNLSPNGIILREGMPVAKLIIVGCQSEREVREAAHFYYGDSTSLTSLFPKEFNLGDSNDER